MEDKCANAEPLRGPGSASHPAGQSQHPDGPDRAVAASNSVAGGGEFAPAQTDPKPKRPGRKPGSGRVPGSGRKKGVPNKVTADIKEMIQKRGKPIELLCDVARGLKIRVGPQAGPGEPEYVYPDLPTRIAAARTLVAKLVPDLKSAELTGAGGTPLLEPTRRAELLGTMEAARLILATLREGVEAEAEFNELDAPTIDAEPVLISSPEEAETPPLAPCTKRGEIPLCGVQSGSDAKRT